MKMALNAAAASILIVWAAIILFVVCFIGYGLVMLAIDFWDKLSHLDTDPGWVFCFLLALATLAVGTVSLRYLVVGGVWALERFGFLRGDDDEVPEENSGRVEVGREDPV